MDTSCVGKFSIVLLNWNGEKYVYDCVQSVLNQTYQNFELIIVDNDSQDGSTKKLHDIYSSDNKFKFIFNNKNYGFSKGMNIGISECDGEFILLLNNDIYLKENFLELSLQKFREFSDVDCIGGRAYHWTNGIKTNDIQFEALFYKKRMQGTTLASDKEIFCFGPHGSFPLIRKKALDNVIEKSGYAYDEDFGTGWEDTDLWFRFQLFGHKTLYVPTIIAWHVGSASANEESRLIRKSIEYQTRVLRNRYYVINKNYTKEMLKKYKFALGFTELVLFPYYLLKSPKTLQAIKKAKILVKENKENVLKKRELIQKNVVVDYDYIKQFFIKF